MENNHCEYAWSDIGISSGISACLKGEREMQDWALRRLTTTANSKSLRKAFDNTETENCIANWSVTYRAEQLKLQKGLMGKEGKKNNQQDSQAKIKTTAASWFVHIEYPYWAFWFL